MKTITAPWDQNRRKPINETERKVDSLPARWQTRFHEIYVGQPWPPTITEAQALLQVESEILFELDECPCFLPEQHCHCEHVVIYDDAELPY